MPRHAIAITLVLIAVTLAGCRAPAADGLSYESRPLSDADPSRTRLGTVQVLSIHELRSGHRWFGGISGMTFDGTTITAINDVGHWLRFRMTVDGTGRPVSFSDLEVAPLGGLDGTKWDGDAEEIRAIPGGWLVSFERRHRVLRYGNDLSGPPQRLEMPTDYASQPENGGVEAMTPLADGRLLLLSEDGTGPDGLGKAWIGRPGEWNTLSYHRVGQFHPTSAALLPDGDVLVLERRFSLIGGVASRLVKLAAKDIQPGARLEGKELFILEPPLLVDNYEGMATWRRQDGRTVVYIVSDDNFSDLQATLLMAILLPD